MSLARQTVLVIEDDPNDILLFERVFKQASASRPFHTIRNGESAIAYLEGQGEYADRRLYPLPALVFIDLKLPGITGFEILTWIRQQARLKKTQVVVLTGSPLTIDIYRAYELGANSYLVKPISIAAVVGLAKSLNLPWLIQATPPLVEMSPAPPSLR